MNEQLSTWEHVQRLVIDLAIQFGPKVVVAIAIVLVGVYAGRWVGEVADGGLKKFQLDLPVRQLLVKIVRILVLALFVIMALQNLGVQLIPLVAGLGVAGAGVALAMQGVLGNIVAGLTIIFTKPFNVGEYISIVGSEGVVEDINLFDTVLSHGDMSRVVIPNRKIVGEILHNYGTIRQVDISVGVAYDTDLDKALLLVKELLNKDSRVLKDPSPVIAIAGFTNISISISVKPWVNLADFGPAKSDITKEIVNAFHANNIDIPFYKAESLLLEQSV